ncbi:hypothetical protein AEGHOMDF_4865 [Methylobacterium soli]|nr:hypothetical protein AEGHOMDF_4865 [Methylobacterium soli]
MRGRIRLRLLARGGRGGSGGLRGCRGLLQRLVERRDLGTGRLRGRIGRVERDLRGPDLDEGCIQGRAREAAIGQRRVDGGRIVEGLIDDEIRDDARIGIHHRAAVEPHGLRRGRAHRAVIPVREDDLPRGAGAEDDAVVGFVAVDRIGDARERVVGRTPLVAAGHEVVVAAIHRAQAVGRERARNREWHGRVRREVPVGVEPDLRERRSRRMRFRDLDLLQDELEIMLDDGNHNALPRL